MTLSAEQYATLQHQIVTLAGLVADMPLAEFLTMINRSHSVGCMVDPTLYRKALGNLTIIENLARALVPFQAAAIDAQQKVLEKAAT